MTLRDFEVEPVRYLSAKDLLDQVSPAELIAEIEQGLRDFATGKVIVPNRQHVDFDGNTLLTMPAIGKRVFGVKVVSVVPANASRGQRVVNGLMILSDGETGAPLAVLDAAMLTAQRTGVVGALGLKYTTPPSITRIGIIGVGIQGTWQAIYASAVREIESIYFVDHSDDSAQLFINEISAYLPRVTVSRCVDARELVRKSQAVITATTSNVPVLPNDCELLENNHFISIGSFKPSMQELPNAAYELAERVIVDSDAAKSEVGDLIGPMSLGLIRDEDLIHIADLVTGQRTIDTAQTTVFKSVGNALYDLYAAQAFLQSRDSVKHRERSNLISRPGHSRSEP